MDYARSYKTERTLERQEQDETQKEMVTGIICCSVFLTAIATQNICFLAASCYLPSKTEKLRFKTKVTTESH